MFKLSKLTDYAVVVLSALEKAQPSHVAVASVADQTHLPEPTVSKVLKLLGKAEIVRSVRGANGGYVFQQSLSDVSVLDVVVAIEGPLSVVACVDHEGDSCVIESHCMMRGRWELVNDALKEALGSVTLRDMMAQKQCERRAVAQDLIMEGRV